MWRSLSIASLGLTLLSLNAAAQPAPPPMAQSVGPDDQQGADQGQYAQADMNCRRSAASRTGYRADGTSAMQQHYAAAYYACMDAASGAPSAPDDYAYPPPPAYYSYGLYPYPYLYAYPYYYPPYYYGPGISFGFGFGGGRGGFHGGGRR